MQARKPDHWGPYYGLYARYYQHSTTEYVRWRPKGSPDFLLLFTIGGSGRLTTDKGSIRTVGGDVALYSPNERHDYCTDPEVGFWDHWWVHFRPRPTWQPWLNWPMRPEGMKILRLDGEGRENFRQGLANADRLALLPIPEALELAMNALEGALLWAHASVPGKQWLTRDARVGRAMDYLRVHSTKPFQMEKLAAHCGLSSSRLSHLFKEENQTTPQQYLENLRMQQAATLLRITNRSITEIAAEIGYDDPFYFTHRFRRYAGRSPTLFRKLYSDGGEPQPGRPEA